MRSLPAPELARILDGSARWCFRVETRAPGASTWTDLTATAGGDWVVGIRTDGETPDAPVTRFSVRLLRATAEGSTAPGISASPLNRAGAVFKPVAYPGREVRIFAAALAAGQTRADAVWRLWLVGEVEDVDWPTDEVVLACTTLDGAIEAAQIEEEEERGAADPGTPLATEIQGLLTRWKPGVTLRTIGDPELGIGPYKTALGALGAQNRAHAQRIAWDVRYRWDDAAQAYRYTLYLPPRGSTTPAFTFQPGTTYEVEGQRVSREYVRNAFALRYRDAATGEIRTATRENAASILEFGRRWMLLDETGDGSAIQNAAQADVLLAYADNDLSQPLTTTRRKVPFNPWLALHDVVTLAADAQTYDFPGIWAVVGISHEVDATGGVSTSVELRAGSPVGMYYGWFTREGGDPSELPGTFELERDPTTGELILVANTTTTEPLSWRARVTTAPVDVDGFAEPTFTTAPGEIAGDSTTFGERIHTGVLVKDGEAGFLAGYFIHADTADAAAQKAAQRSRLVRTWCTTATEGPDAIPLLDEDQRAVALVPNRNARAKAVRYRARTDRPPTLAEVRAGTVSTAERVDVHTFAESDDGVTLYVGVLAYAKADGSGAEGPLRQAQLTYRAADDRPVLSWLPAAASAGHEAVRLTLVDDGDAVALEYRTYPKGGTPPAYTRLPASGYAPDPLVQVVTVTSPAEGAPPVVLEARGYDDQGNQSDPLYLEIDADPFPSGTLSVTVDERTGDCRVIANTADSDSGSYRYRVAKGALGSGAFAAVSWSDATAGEYAGNDFGVPRLLPAAYRLASGEELYVEGYFLRTTSTAGTQQQASLRSARQRVSVPLGVKKEPAALASFTLAHDQAGNRMVARAVQGEGAQSVVIRIASNDVMSGATSATLAFSGGEAVHTLPSPAGGTYYADAVPWTGPGASGERGARYRADATAGAVQPLVGNALALIAQRWGPGAGAKSLELEVQYGTTVRSFRVQYTYASVPGGATDRAVNYVVSPLAAGGGRATYTLEDELGGYRMWPAGEYPSGLVLTPYDAVAGGGASGVPIYMGISMDDVPVTAGGTGRKTLDNKAIVVGAGTAPVAFIAPGGAGAVVKSVAGAWVAGTLSSAEIAAGLGAPGGGQLLYSPYAGDLQYTAGGNVGDVPTLQAGGVVMWKPLATGGGATLPTVTTSDNGKHLQVRGGAWALSNLIWPTIIGVQGQVIVANSSGQPTWGNAPTPTLAGHSPGTGLSGSVYNGSGAATWNVDFGTGVNQAARGNHTHSEYFGAAGGIFTGTVRFTGAVSESVLGQTRLDIGIGSGTPRLLFEQGGSVYGMDYSSGQFRWYTPGSVRMQLSTAGNLSLPWGSVTATTFYTSSRRAKKRDILPFLDDALGIVRRTNVVRYHWREGEDTSWRVGFVAEDTDALLAGEKHDRMDVPNVVGVLLRAVQQLSERLERLELSGGARGY